MSGGASARRGLGGWRSSPPAAVGRRRRSPPAVGGRDWWGRHGWGQRADGDSGQIMLLTLGFAVLALVLVLVVASATAVHIERKRLLALADAAAADAADALDTVTYYTTQEAGAGTPTRVPLTDTTVRSAVDAYLGQAPADLLGEFDQLRVAEPTGTTDGYTAQVTLSSVARPPLVPWVLERWRGGIALQATATARGG